jgi:hypothetical protein
MLDPNDPRGFRIETNDKLVKLGTCYFDIRVHLDEKDGMIRTQLELDSRPAFEVLCVEPPYPKGGEPRVLLITKKRMENAFHRGDDLPTITKVPGGYDHSGGGVSLGFMRDRLLSETGYWIDTSPEHLQCIGRAVGHTEIRTPISLWICTGWGMHQAPREGVEAKFVPLSVALELADNAIRCTPGAERIENETGVELLYLFERMYRHYKISLGDLGQPPLQMGKPLSILPT